MIFYMGGFGNVSFQALHARELKIRYHSTFFLKKHVQNITKQSSQNIDVMKYVNVSTKHTKFEFILIGLLFIDFLIALVIRKSLITELDTRKVKCSPLLKPYLYFGYFQETAKLHELSTNRIVNIELDQNCQNDVIYCHFRGGDFVEHGMVPNTDFLIKSVEHFPSNIKSIQILTQDYKYFQSNILIPDGFSVNHSPGSFEADYATLANAKYYIGSASTYGTLAFFETEKCKIGVLPNDFFSQFKNIEHQDAKKVFVA